MESQNLLESQDFQPEIAFSRTLGFLTSDELKVLQKKTVAIAGLGGVGGSHLITLTRLGIGRFHLADFDEFELQNFNRQSGASLGTLGQKKVDVMERLARQINPQLQINLFPDGLTATNVGTFLQDVDVYVDGLDFFAFDARSAVFKACSEKKIPAVTVAPLGMGAALLNFLPGKMSFQDYFNWRPEDSDLVKSIKFLVGLTPSLPHRRYIVDRSFVDLRAGKGPSTPMGSDLCAGVAGTEILKILLRRGPVSAAPRSVHFDAYYNRLYSQTVWFGNRNPWQKIKIMVAARVLSSPGPSSWFERR